ncbi:MAG TPA: hypothetical protein VGB75_17720 [Jatrophihabitans sp.]|jgi:hypothetical protein|uniref:DUF7718 family protein n=1 Tax=Jatrophihabitans sp. TaxID=1932789 RepID=UPI002EFC8CFD
MELRLEPVSNLPGRGVVTKAKGRMRNSAGLVDMTVRPEPPRPYQPPPASQCEVNETDSNITDTDRVYLRVHSYKNRIVDFALMQYRKYGGEWVEVLRIDCTHGSIHRHEFDPDGTERRIEMIPIPTSTGRGQQSWDVVDAGYQEAYDWMFGTWDERAKAW